MQLYHLSPVVLFFPYVFLFRVKLLRLDNLFGRQKLIVLNLEIYNFV